ncbi:hypothetical protein K2173_016258 [Erythroxylum novogranatense]|uniref:Protein kinase domain-containing protein n=1 Tax=Erythroxylum novogranatense TaxID=1862640 RepID=A0AAV8SFS1_9ROSI|nr:hypothetical protein K2173_016258 [Erythroxylum novogranatense]
MSPELVRERKYESAADIWALGCTVLEMITGVPAWNYQDEQDLLKFIGYSDRIPYIPSKCLVKNANHRWSPWALLEHPFVSVHSGCHLSWKETAFTCCCV